MSLYPVNLPGLAEASTLKIRDLIRSEVANINAAINRDAVCPMTLTTDQIVRYDTVRLESSRISVIGGGEDDGRDMTIEEYFMPRTDTSGMKEFISKNIYVFLHIDEFSSITDEDLRAEAFEVALDRISDSLRKRIFNRPENAVLQLTSREHATAPDFDIMQTSFVREIRKGLTEKQIGGVQLVPFLHIIYNGEIA